MENNTKPLYKVEYHQYEDGSHVCLTDEHGNWLADFGNEGVKECEDIAQKVLLSLSNLAHIAEALEFIVKNYTDKNLLHLSREETSLYQKAKEALSKIS